jgi:hypothetical protein
MNSTYVGPVTLEGTLVFPVISRNTSDVPTAADAAPTYSIYNASMSAVLTTGTTSALSGVTGGYTLSKAITAALGFAAGNEYVILVEYALSSSARTDTYRFSVI